MNSLFIECLNNVNFSDDSLTEYLYKSLRSEKDKNKLCLGWDYLKENITYELRDILNLKRYWDLFYNSEKVNFILNQLYTTEEINQFTTELIKQLESFVYLKNQLKRDCEKLTADRELKTKLENEGFKEQDIFNIEELKKLDHLKVIAFVDISKIGLMGSFDKKEQLEGTLIFNNDNLYLMPKRCTKKGYLIKNKFYYKELKGGLKE